MTEKQLTRLFGFGASAIATEHWFTFSLSSLPTTRKFFAEEPQSVRNAYLIATGLSVCTAGVLTYLGKDWIPLFTALGLSGICIYLYEQALAGKI